MNFFSELLAPLVASREIRARISPLATALTKQVADICTTVPSFVIRTREWVPDCASVKASFPNIFRRYIRCNEKSKLKNRILREEPLNLRTTSLSFARGKSRMIADRVTSSESGCIHREFSRKNFRIILPLLAFHEKPRKFSNLFNVIRFPGFLRRRPAAPLRFAVYNEQWNRYTILIYLACWPRCGLTLHLLSVGSNKGYVGSRSNLWSPGALIAKFGRVWPSGIPTSARKQEDPYSRWHRGNVSLTRLFSSLLLSSSLDPQTSRNSRSFFFFLAFFLDPSWNISLNLRSQNCSPQRDPTESSASLPAKLLIVFVRAESTSIHPLLSEFSRQSNSFYLPPCLSPLNSSHSTPETIKGVTSNLRLRHAAFNCWRVEMRTFE